MKTKKLTFSKTNRLQTSADFQAVFNQQPIRVKSTYFTMLARPNKSEYARLGLIVAKRIIKRAVKRNAIRRLIRESFRVNQHRLVGLDVVVLVRCVLPQQPNQVFYECLRHQWQSVTKQWQKALLL